MTKNNTKIMKKRLKLTVFTSPISLEILNLSLELSFCDTPNPGVPLTTRQPAEFLWISGDP